MKSIYLLDACCVINLYGSGRSKEILRSINGSVQVSEQVAGEAMWVKVAGNHPIQISIER